MPKELYTVQPAESIQMIVIWECNPTTSGPIINTHFWRVMTSRGEMRVHEDTVFSRKRSAIKFAQELLKKQAYRGWACQTH